MTDRILIIDFGSQVTQLIARRVRESGVYSEIHPFNKVSSKSIKDFKPNGVILSGGPASVTEMDTPRAPDELFNMGLPVLGICYGQQTMIERLGGKVETNEKKEFGHSTVAITGDCKLLDATWRKGSQQQVWMSHGDRVTSLPSGFHVVGKSNASPYAIVADDDRKFYGVQFHPEVVHTPYGAELIRTFTHAIAGCSGNWTMAAFKDQKISRLRKEGRLLCRRRAPP